MKSSYLLNLALPPDIEFDAMDIDDSTVDMAAVLHYVAQLKSRPDWYRGMTNKTDTRLYMMEVRQPFHLQYLKNIDGRNVQTRMWFCESCGEAVPYAAVHLGHAPNMWRQELINAGVMSPAEAKAAYNNLNNLIIECASCNQSHDFEAI